MASKDTSVTKVSSQFSPRGEMGQKYLATGVKLGMRLWEDEQPGEAKPPSVRDYETVGFCLKGRAELHVDLVREGIAWFAEYGSEPAVVALPDG